MDWKMIFGMLAGFALIAAAMSLGGPMTTPQDRRNACVASVKDKPTVEIERICGKP